MQRREFISRSCAALAAPIVIGAAALESQPAGYVRTDMRLQKGNEECPCDSYDGTIEAVSASDEVNFKLTIGKMPERPKVGDFWSPGGSHQRLWQYHSNGFWKAIV